VAWTDKKKVVGCVLKHSIGVCVSAWMLTGCGMKGPLVLPDQKAPAKVVPMHSTTHLPASNGDVLDGEGHQ